MKLTDKQKEALTALAEVMRKHEIDTLRDGIFFKDGTFIDFYTINEVEIKELLQEQE